MIVVDASVIISALRSDEVNRAGYPIGSAGDWLEDHPDHHKDQAHAE